MNSAEYQITIKSANQKVDDYVLDCKSTWTVQRLKQHISDTHINKPKSEDQRLIYAGNLLKDSLTLKQVFFRDSLCTELTNSSKTDFTIHLVCSTQLQKSSSSQPKSNPSSSTRLASASGSSTAPSPSSSTDQARQRVNISDQNQNTSQSNAAATSNTESSSGAQQGNSMTATQIAEVAMNLLQSDQMRQQTAIYQQLANLVAAQLVENLANSSLLNSAQTIPNVGHADGAVLPDLTPLFDSQSLNIQTPITTNDALRVDHNLLASSVASQMLVSPNQQSNILDPTSGNSVQSSEVHRNEQNLNGDNQAHAPLMEINDQPAGANFDLNIRAPEAAVPAAVEAAVQPPPPQQGPVIEQPVRPQALDHEPLIQNDVIDWVYYSIRAIILMAALYIHASLFRLLFIVVLLAVAYFFNRRSTRRRIHNRMEQILRDEPAIVRIAIGDQFVERQQGEGNPARPAELGAAQAVGPNAGQNLADHDREGEFRRRQVAGVANEAVNALDQVQDQEGELRRRRVAGAANEADGQTNDQENHINDDNDRHQQLGGHGRPSFLKLCYLVVTDFLRSLIPE